MKIFLDTNFIIDWLFREEYKTACEQLLVIGDQRNIRFAVSFLSLANMAYIARKQPKELLYSNLSKLCTLFEIIANNKEHILRAINMGASDYEDALQYSSAIEAGCDCIITRNSKDFQFSEIPVMSATEFMEKFH